ncbi:dynein regulatory complex protein 9-like [Anthonomus grandis grandis]|uniref:dynein regulatory complex protein 9-like n=1 Tax=Anthonomus grandis grandis TaxID=2921223 RepID=UPI002165157D|nr:dynein regulatory complex protein 9-like [Anthonomus grandis grandis]
MDSCPSNESELKCIKPEDILSSQSLYWLGKSEIFNDITVPPFIRNVIMCILSECLNELIILRSINLQSDLGLNPDRLPQYVSIETRYMGQENHAEYRINSQNSSFDKLAKDINMLFVVLKETSLEIKKYGTFNVLKDTIKLINQMQEEEEQLLADEASQERVIEDLKSQLEEERLDNIRTIEETDAKIQKLRFQVEDIFIYNQLEVLHFDQWEKARIEQNLMKCKEKESHYNNIIKETEEKINVENRCHNELESYFEETKNELFDEIQFWMKKYDEEFEGKESDTINLRAALEKLTEERRILTEKYEKRKAEIDDWLEYKRIRDEKEAQRLKEIAAATKIQAWWRGVMFRKKLGPYRKKKGKGKDKGKKKKGKK